MCDNFGKMSGTAIIHCIYFHETENGKNKSAYKSARAVLFLTVFLGGCESAETVKPAQNNAVKLTGFSASGDKMNEVERMERCRRELESLKRVDATVYNKRKAEFDKLMSGASLYNGVRNDVGNYTQGQWMCYIVTLCFFVFFLMRKEFFCDNAGCVGWKF